LSTWHFIWGYIDEEIMKREGENGKRQKKDKKKLKLRSG
jgi:hypothetical protein